MSKEKKLMDDTKSTNNTERKSTLDKVATIILLGICLFLTFLVGRSALGAKKSGPALQQVEKTNTVNVITRQLEPTLFEKKTTVGGDIQDSIDTQNIYSTEISGTITALYLQEGQSIKAGDVIATVDPSSAGETYKAGDVTARINGIVYSVDSYVGEKITTSTVLGTIGNAGDLEIIAYLPEQYLSTVSVGMKAEFTMSAWPDDKITATVKAISPNVDSTSRAFKVTLTVDGDEPRLKVGMYVRLKLTTESLENAITVPTSAITTYLGQDVVYIVEDGTAKRVSVTRGSNNDTETVITDGLKAGDVLITSGSVTDGTPVNIVTD